MPLLYTAKEERTIVTDIFSPEKRSQIMASVKGKNTKVEFVIRRELFRLGTRYRVNNTKIFGKPDISIKKYKIAVFIDGDWWHGRNYRKEADKYPVFWQEKIGKNMERDKKVTRMLRNDGWIVLRFWQKDIEKNPSKFANFIINQIGKFKTY